eukprot:7390780-Prymnesium_polylepis.2
MRRAATKWVPPFPCSAFSLPARVLLGTPPLSPEKTLRSPPEPFRSSGLRSSLSAALDAGRSRKTCSGLLRMCEWPTGDARPFGGPRVDEDVSSPPLYPPGDLMLGYGTGAQRTKKPTTVGSSPTTSCEHGEGG